jgi:hypothetical protein
MLAEERVIKSWMIAQITVVSMAVCPEQTDGEECITVGFLMETDTSDIAREPQAHPGFIL